MKSTTVTPSKRRAAHWHMFPSNAPHAVITYEHKHVAREFKRRFVRDGLKGKLPDELAGVEIHIVECRGACLEAAALREAQEAQEATKPGVK